MEPPGPFPRSDLGSFSDFRRPIIAVRGNCVIKDNLVGWAVTGMKFPGSLLGSQWLLAVTDY